MYSLKTSSDYVASSTIRPSLESKFVVIIGRGAGAAVGADVGEHISVRGGDRGSDGEGDRDARFYGLIVH